MEKNYEPLIIREEAIFLRTTQKGCRKVIWQSDNDREVQNTDTTFEVINRK